MQLTRDDTGAQRPPVAAAEDVHRFWFAGAADDARLSGARGEIWFGTSAEFDAQIRERFEPTIALAGRGGLASWESTPRSCVALVIVLDQFPRNAYRNTAAAFAHDALALEVARRGIAAGYLDALAVAEQAFLLMPFQHVEDVAAQREGVLWFERVHANAAADWRGFTGNTLDFARQHLEIVERFGRFPHRNAALGREPTPDERKYLDSKPQTFGQGG